MKVSFENGFVREILINQVSNKATFTIEIPMNEIPYWNLPLLPAKVKGTLEFDSRISMNESGT